jgi:pilus assembly protein Flp/PilA
MVMNLVKKFLQDESGATMVEYALMLALIAAVLIGTWQGLSTTTETTIGDVDTAMSGQ